jgi:hypothetical protein
MRCKDLLFVPLFVHIKLVLQVIMAAICHYAVYTSLT